MSFTDGINRQINCQAENIGKYQALREVAEALDMDKICEETKTSPSFSIWGPYKEIYFYSYEGEEKLKHVLKLLLPKVGKFGKSFNENEGKIVLSATYKDVVISLHISNPSTCKVEKVEEIEQIPASTRTVVKYKLVGKCAPLMVEGLEEEGSS